MSSKNPKVLMRVASKRGRKFKQVFIYDHIAKGPFGDHPTRENYILLGTLHGARLEIQPRFPQLGGWGYTSTVFADVPFPTRDVLANNPEILQTVTAFCEWIADDALRILYESYGRYQNLRDETDRKRNEEFEADRTLTTATAMDILNAGVKRARESLQALVIQPTLSVEELFYARTTYFASYERLVKFSNLMIESANSSRQPGTYDPALNMAKEIVRYSATPPTPLMRVA